MRAMTTWFCDAYASWQKGGVENANGRLRRWLPRQIDIDKVSDQEIQDIVITANLTPRKCLGFKILFRQSSKTLAKTCKSGSRKALLHLALESRPRRGVRLLNRSGETSALDGYGGAGRAALRWDLSRQRHGSSLRPRFLPRGGADPPPGLQLRLGRQRSSAAGV